MMDGSPDLAPKALDFVLVVPFVHTPHNEVHFEQAAVRPPQHMHQPSLNATAAKSAEQVQYAQGSDWPMSSQHSAMRLGTRVLVCRINHGLPFPSVEGEKIVRVQMTQGP